MIPLTVIAGPTASGKSALAVDWAEAMGAEIVGADSQQVYRHFDLGTAKPSPEELRRVPHHLISVVEPLESFSAARYQKLADEAIQAIHARGRRVLVVGGTGLYIRVLLHGVMEGPAADPELRARLEAEISKEGPERLHARLAELDPAAAKAISARDRVRIIRALEIHEKTGRPASEQRQAHGFAPRRYDSRLFVLDPPREALYAAIDARTRALFEHGLVQEAKALAERGFADAPPMRSVGYAQALQVVRGELTEAQAVAQAAQATRHYAKRQRTWFRKEPDAKWVAPPYAQLRALT